MAVKVAFPHVPYGLLQCRQTAFDILFNLFVGLFEFVNLTLEVSCVQTFLSVGAGHDFKISNEPWMVQARPDCALFLGHSDSGCAVANA
jgi:hypothetical protein